MTLQELNNTFQIPFKSIDFHHIRGEYYFDTTPLQFWLSLGGIPISFYRILSQMDRPEEEFPEADLILSEIVNRDTSNKDRLYNFIVKTIKEGLKSNILAIPVTYSFDTNFQVLSKYGYREIYYKPEIIKLGCDINNTIDEVTDIFVKGIIDYENNPLLLAEGYLSKNANISDFSMLLNEADQLLKLYDEIILNDFNNKKNNYDYQHRHDHKPSIL